MDLSAADNVFWSTSSFRFLNINLWASRSEDNKPNGKEVATNLVAPGKKEVDLAGEDWVKLVHFEDFLDVDADDHFRLQDLPLVSHLARGCIIVVSTGNL